MKTDYAVLGNCALERLRSTCENADNVQKQILLEILDTILDT